MHAYFCVLFSFCGFDSYESNSSIKYYNNVSFPWFSIGANEGPETLEISCFTFFYTLCIFSRGCELMKDALHESRYSWLDQLQQLTRSRRVQHNIVLTTRECIFFFRFSALKIQTVIVSLTSHCIHSSLGPDLVILKVVFFLLKASFLMQASMLKSAKRALKSNSGSFCI